MLCEKCKKNEATYYFHENVNGRERTFRLCDDCAAAMQEKGELPEIGTDRFFEDFDSFFEDSIFANPFRTVGNLLGGFFGGDRALTSGERGKKEEKKCPGCGTTLREFAQRGAGCPKCYETFEAELAPTVSRAHGGSEHTGRVPLKYRDRIERKHRIEALEAERAEAVKNENYERAAEIRDELKALREENAAALKADVKPAEDAADGRTE
ncbi:MAG: UvrB/UvrC motif-containing protein [Clostridia bacterium]|nr:UvrB/UvrC motif-containing protein [Clostridia bacterium]